MYKVPKYFTLGDKPEHFRPVEEELEVVKHEKWEQSQKYKGYLVCSGCGDCFVEPEWVLDGKWKYCPCCGARMDGLSY